MEDDRAAWEEIVAHLMPEIDEDDVRAQEVIHWLVDGVRQWVNENRLNLEADSPDVWEKVVAVLCYIQGRHDMLRDAVSSRLIDAVHHERRLDRLHELIDQHAAELLTVIFPD